MVEVISIGATVGGESCAACSWVIARAGRTPVRCECGAEYVGARPKQRPSGDHRARQLRADMHLVARFRAKLAPRGVLGSTLTGGPPTAEERKAFGAPSWAKGESAPSPLPAPACDAEADARDAEQERQLSRGRQLDARVRAITDPRAAAVLGWLIERAGHELERATGRSLECHLGLWLATPKQRKAWARDSVAMATALGTEALAATVRVWSEQREAA